MALRFGADVVINPMKTDVVAAIRDITRRGEGADKAIECSANPLARRQSIEAVRRWGTACMVGAYGKVEFDVSEVIQRQKTVLGSTTFSKNMQDDCAQYVVERGLDVDSLFTHQFALDEAEEAYRLFDTQTTGKGVFVFS
jgi:threonine dehydrogenase-like Zn-dependent dehydrogenase